MREKLLICLAVLLALPCMALGMGKSPVTSEKPRSPLSVTIEEGGTPETGLSGAARSLLVTVSSAFDADEVVVTVRLTGGARLVEGESEWRIALSKGESASRTMVVEPPERGGGRVTVVASYKGKRGSASFRARGVYVFDSVDPNEKTQGTPERGVLRPGGIVEYPAR